MNKDTDQPTAEYPASVDAWGHKRVVTIDLDEETKVDLRLPDLGVWITQGRIPNPLVAIAEQIEYRSLDITKVSKDERKKFYDLQAFVIATHLVQPNILAEFDEDKGAAAEWVKNEMPPEHRMRIWARCFHILSGEDMEEALRSLSELEPFREGSPSAHGSGAGEGDQTAT